MQCIEYANQKCRDRKEDHIDYGKRILPQSVPEVRTRIVGQNYQTHEKLCQQQNN